MHSYMRHSSKTIIFCGILKFYDVCAIMLLSKLELKKMC
jgi:hypothetical protein